MLRLLRHWPGR